MTPPDVPAVPALTADELVAAETPDVLVVLENGALRDVRVIPALANVSVELVHLDADADPAERAADEARLAALADALDSVWQ